MPLFGKKDATPADAATDANQVSTGNPTPKPTESTDKKEKKHKKEKKQTQEGSHEKKGFFSFLKKKKRHKVAKDMPAASDAAKQTPTPKLTLAPVTGEVIVVPPSTQPKESVTEEEIEVYDGVPKQAYDDLIQRAEELNDALDDVERLRAQRNEYRNKLRAEEQKILALERALQTANDTLTKSSPRAGKPDIPEKKSYPSIVLAWVDTHVPGAHFLGTRVIKPSYKGLQGLISWLTAQITGLFVFDKKAKEKAAAANAEKASAAPAPTKTATPEATVAALQSAPPAVTPGFIAQREAVNDSAKSLASSASSSAHSTLARDEFYDESSSEEDVENATKKSKPRVIISGVAVGESDGKKRVSFKS